MSDPLKDPSVYVSIGRCLRVNTTPIELVTPCTPSPCVRSSRFCAPAACLCALLSPAAPAALTDDDRDCDHECDEEEQHQPQLDAPPRSERAPIVFGRDLADPAQSLDLGLVVVVLADGVVAVVNILAGIADRILHALRHVTEVIHIHLCAALALLLSRAIRAVARVAGQHRLPQKQLRRPTPLRRMVRLPNPLQQPAPPCLLVWLLISGVQLALIPLSLHLGGLRNQVCDCAGKLLVIPVLLAIFSRSPIPRCIRGGVQRLPQVDLHARRGRCVVVHHRLGRGQALLLCCDRDIVDRLCSHLRHVRDLLHCRDRRRSIPAQGYRRNQEGRAS
mmetsp:Transcript_8619/g.20356  ORF Transcript_8619/g.20356 Transcript_8619/m.20356 type:complete len:333 (+) Transcript_8619:37-1035(+)